MALNSFTPNLIQLVNYSYWWFTRSCYELVMHGAPQETLSSSSPKSVVVQLLAKVKVTQPATWLKNSFFVEEFSVQN